MHSGLHSIIVDDINRKCNTVYESVLNMDMDG